ncbi:MAG: ABC transporter ATP-binding protein [Pyrinomonadaceae bacterium MAG19_C2-C3]|nr:ABC transporter ATP-binding protein [Pyrinomonadaceae bacterium MAG19_C2-C3]
MTPTIELDGLSVRFRGRTILDDLRGTLKGRATGLLGPNGAGKTTLIHTLLGFHPASSGTARIFGRDIRTEAKAVRAALGYMPERDSFIHGDTCIHFVSMMAELSGLPPDAALERAHEALFYVGLGEARYRTLDTYSLGMKQLAKLAQAIVHAPRLLFLDEPTNGLDPPARARMLELIREIRDGGETHIMLSSHLLRDVEESCDEILILKDGRVRAMLDLEAERRANRRFFELELRGATERFGTALESLGCEYAFTNNLQGNLQNATPNNSNGNTQNNIAASLETGTRLKLVLPENIEIADLYRIAADQHIQIRRLNHKRDSLEDIFLKAMEDSG